MPVTAAPPVSYEERCGGKVANSRQPLTIGHTTILLKKPNPIQAQIQRAKRYQRLSSGLRRVSILLYAGIFAAAFVATRCFDLDSSLVVYLTLGLFCAVFGSVWYADRLSVKWRDAVREMLSSQDMHSVGTLLEVLGDMEALESAQELRQALTQLLNRVQAVDRGLFTSGHRQILYRELDRFSQPEHRHDDSTWPMALIHAVEQIGDTKALPILRKLTLMPERTGYLDQIQRAASIAIARMEQRFVQERASQTLLRPSSSIPAASGAMLLRPASGSPQTPADQLLRPGDADPADRPANPTQRNGNHPDL